MSYWICSLFFFSGLSALIYEIAWLRILSWSLGNTSDATMCVLAAFLGGLAAGALIGGRIADRLQSNLLPFYSRIEICIAITAVAVSLLALQMPFLFSAISHALPFKDTVLPIARFIMCACILLIPTALMGATMPILTRFLALYNGPSTSFARLYSANTLGAVTGSLAACFLGFPYLGVMGTIYLAAAINLAIGCLAFLFSIANKSLAVTKDREDERDIDVIHAVQSSKSSDLLFLCLLSALSGFSALSYEILWTRLLRFYCVSTTYAFTIMTSSVILGLGLGSIIYEKCLAEKKTPKQQLTSLAFTQCIAALLATASLVFMPLASLFVHTTSSSGAENNLLALLLIGLIFIVPPATVIGITFPIIGGLAVSFKQIGSGIGFVYGANTLGCVLGAIIVGFIVQHGVSSFSAFQVTIIFTALIATFALLKSVGFAKPLSLAICSAPLVVFLGLVPWIPDPLQRCFLEKKQPILSYGEDATGIVMVLERGDFRELRTGSSAVSSTAMPAKRYMRLMGALPSLLHKNPQEALVICFGTGTTADAVAASTSVKHLDIVELSSEVLKNAPLFANANNNVLANKKVSTFVNDGRNFLLFSRSKYDIMSFEPPPQTEAGIVNLYSREFYQLTKDHLKPGGIVCQWVPIFYEGTDIWKMMVRSARDVFPNVSIWLPNNGEAMLIASMEPIKIDAQEMQTKMDASPDLKKALSEVGFADPYAILSTFILGGRRLDNYLGGLPPITDDRLQMEFCLPYISKELFVWNLQSVAGDIQQCLQESFEMSHVDKQSLQKNLEALNALRMRTQSLLEGQNPTKQQDLIDKALHLTPNNRFFQYAKDHSDGQG